MRFRPLLALVLALCLTLVTACSGGAKAVDRSQLTYEEIHNTGLANDCPTLPESARGSIALDPGATYQLREICMHPSEVSVKAEPANKRQEARFVPGKILTRFTTSLDQVYGDLSVAGDTVKFQEQGGLDFQLITVLMPGGEEVPFVFSSKQLQATADGAAISTSTDFNGTYRVPSYRTSNFLDPKARGLTTGVEYAQGLVGLTADNEEIARENIKRYVEGTGSMELSITRVDPGSGEFAGVFTALQPSDTDMGSKDPLDVKITGELYGRLEQV
ncbi:MAG: photosystem II manganese-stabilizing polypeptide [Synechococcaceae cyanobacterium]